METHQSTEVVTAHLTDAKPVDGKVVTTLCGLTQRVNMDINRQCHAAENPRPYIYCALCEAAQLLADVQIPHLEQGELFS
jgi:hypothetical protein